MTTGTLYIISAPSGAGKTSLLTKVRSQITDLKIAVSHTTRDPRPGEIEGEHYYFVTQEEFTRMIKMGDFLEYAQVFGNFYGTSKQTVDTLLNLGEKVVLEIDWQGARQVRENYPQAISVFILPPGIEELENRLRSRGQDSEQVISQRMGKARSEISHYSEYEYLVINDDLPTAIQQLTNIFSQIERFRPPEAEKLEKLLSSL